jgi:Zn finger protein HypA/HybF involved in hydrogenase expression
MGEREFWRCPGCGYRELVSDGVDTGIRKAVVTIACDDCRELLEVVLREPASAVDEKLDRCPTWEPERLKCPYSQRHEVQLWRYGGPCPRCGEATERDPDEPALHWQ